MEVVYGDARVLDELLADHGVGLVDVVVSGLPWSLFSPDKEGETLGRIAGYLAPRRVHYRS
jgi:phosphatidylethanolamine/phosphatidyl-N-methylethanolamine N-methyltransferase